MTFLYEWPAFVVSVVVILVAVALAVGGLALARRFALPHIVYHDDANDALSGALGAIGVFYGIVVGLIAIDVWQRHSNAEDITAREAAAIQSLYLMVSAADYRLGLDPSAKPTDEANASIRGKPTPAAEKVAKYLQDVICVAWKEQREGKRPRADWEALRAVRAEIESIEPITEGAKVRYAATVQTLNDLSELRRLRVDAADDRLAERMWIIIICGAVMNMLVVYLLRIKDVKLHFAVVAMSAGLLGLVLLIIFLHNRPFLGDAGIEPNSYTDAGWILPGKGNPFRNVGWLEACSALKTNSSK